MAGIDLSLAPALASQVDRLLTHGLGSFSNQTTQAGASALSLETPDGGPAPAATNPALLKTPQPSAQTALSVVALLLASIERVGTAEHPALVGEAPIWPSSPATPGLATGPSAAQQTQAAALSTAIPVSAMAAALAQVVSSSGLFYESHLAQWLTGQRSVNSLLAEPQTALAAGVKQPAQGGADALVDKAPNADVFSASVHPATVALVRQQLEVLATDQFRWTGEAWPGAKLDWLIEPEGGQHASHDAASGQRAWRTRLTLTLPTLGTIDAELTLAGTRLLARVQASAKSAARLAAQGDGFRDALQAAGFELGALSIREEGCDGTTVYPHAAADTRGPDTIESAREQNNDAPERRVTPSPLERLFREQAKRSES